MSDGPKVSFDTKDIWLPPNTGYSADHGSSLSFIIEVDDPADSLLLYARSELTLIPPTGGAFGVGDYIQHIEHIGPSSDVMGIDIAKVDVAASAGDVAASDPTRRYLRLGRGRHA